MLPNRDAGVAEAEAPRLVKRMGEGQHWDSGNEKAVLGLLRKLIVYQLLIRYHVIIYRERPIYLGHSASLLRGMWDYIGNIPGLASKARAKKN